MRTPAGPAQTKAACPRQMKCDAWESRTTRADDEACSNCTANCNLYPSVCHNMHTENHCNLSTFEATMQIMFEIYGK